MADLFCRDFRSLTTNSNLHLFLPSKRYYPSSLIYSYNLRINGMKTKPLQLLSKPSSPASSSKDIDVISTHEHSDGSLLFRFGDPSEVAKNVEVEESKTVKEEIEKEDEDGAGKISDGDHEMEGMVQKAKTESTGSGLTQMDDHVISAVSSSESISADEGENDSCGKLLEGSNDTELTVSISSEEIEVNSTPVVDIDDTVNVEEDSNKEHEDSCPGVAEVEINTTIVDDEKETAEALEANLETVVNEDSSPEVASIPDESAEMENNTSIVGDKQNAEVLQTILDTVVNKENEYLISAVAAISDKIVEMENRITIVEEKVAAEVLQANLETVLNEEDEDSSPAVASIPEESAEMENITTIVEEKEASDILQANLETDVTTDDSADSEHQYMEADIQNEITEDGKKSGESDLVSPSPESEPAVSLSEEVVDDSEHELEMQNEVIEDGKESVKSDLVSPSLQSEYTVSLSEEIEDQNLQEEVGGNDMNDLVVDNVNGSEMNETEANLVPKEADCSVVADALASGDGTEIVEYESENNSIELMTVSTQLEAETVLDEETGTVNVDESGENDGAESLKVLNDIPQNLILESEKMEVDDNVQSGDLVEASVHGMTELNSSESATESQEILTTDFVLSSGAALLPHPSKVLTGGEDAYFIAGQTWKGVADGVEHWSLEGSKPGIYAQELMKICERLISDCNGNSVNNPLELLSLSIAETQCPGSSTALIAQFDGQALQVANIGDSGFIVLRHGAIYKKSSPMFHEFHFPLQIERGDDPSYLAEVYKVDLEEGDVIITATDGLLDNLYDQEISLIVLNSLAADKKPKEIAELLARKSQEIGSSPSGRSPFADDAQAAGYSGYTGGKLDDVAVIVSLVQKRSNPQTL